MAAAAAAAAGMANCEEGVERAEPVETGGEGAGGGGMPPPPELSF
jgi:hypothetical protein